VNGDRQTGRAACTASLLLAVAAGCSSPDLEGLPRASRAAVHGYATAACELGVLDAARLAPASAADAKPSTVPPNAARKEALLASLADALPTPLPETFRTRTRELATRHGRLLWRDRLRNDAAAFALREGCMEFSRARFMTRRAYREYDANGTLDPGPAISDVKLANLARARWQSAEQRRRPQAILSGSWGDLAGCRHGRRYTFRDGELRMDPLPGREGGPPEYLPMRLTVDEYRGHADTVEVIAGNGESLRIEFPTADRLRIRAGRIALGSVCSSFSGAGELQRCPG